MVGMYAEKYVTMGIPFQFLYLPLDHALLIKLNFSTYELMIIW